MRKSILTIVSGVVGTLALVGVAGLCGYIENHYSIDATVIEVKDDLVVFEDVAGYRWAADNDNYAIDDKVTLKMITNMTDSRVDDDIEKIEKRVDK